MVKQFIESNKRQGPFKCYPLPDFVVRTSHFWGVKLGFRKRDTPPHSSVISILGLTFSSSQFIVFQNLPPRSTSLHLQVNGHGIKQFTLFLASSLPIKLNSIECRCSCADLQFNMGSVKLEINPENEISLSGIFTNFTPPGSNFTPQKCEVRTTKPGRFYT